ncbi:MAG: hypothetical protein HY033_01405 [Ignavibacteriae bacterium]|nr:hypothetical protein [Ignavibacteriota bacterium]
MPLAKLSDDEVKLVQEQIQIKSKNSYHVIAVPKANTIKINSVREIRRDVALTAFSSGKKVFILIDAEYLSDESASALLKTLEEPPEDTLIILTTAYPDQLLPTILSRCQHVRFGPLGAEDIQKALLEREAIEIGEARLIAQMADGSYGRALRLVQSDIHDRRDRVVNFLRTILRGSRMDIVNAIERLASELDKADVEEFLLLLQAWFRDAMVLQHGGGNGSAISGDDALAKFAAHYGAINVAPIITEVERAISLVNKNVYIPLVLMTLAFKLQSSMTTPSTR